MIISVDTGNKQMKTENCEFNSGVEILDTLPGELEEVIEYEGKYYRTTNRRISYMEDKTADERYFILTLFAIAKELSYQQKYEGMLPKNLEEIELLVGLPPAHYGKQRKKFREYFYRNGTIVEFGYRGIPSDVGSSGANIFYTVSANDQYIILGETLKVRHKNCKGTEDFNQNMASIFEYYKAAVQEVLQLCDIWVNHPANAMIGVMKQAGFSKKLIAETVERYRASAGEQPCSAYEIYCGICDVISIARQQETNERGLLLLEEKVAACVNRRWHELDIPGEIKY